VVPVFLLEIDMTTTTTAHRANTGLVFYSGGDQKNALQASDD
jgi:hypothetical protein